MHSESSSEPRRTGFTVVELLVVIALIAVLVALLLVAIGKARDAAARTESTNNLKQIGLAFHSFHDDHKHLPYNGTPAAYQFRGKSHGGPAVAADQATGSWAFMILPYLDQDVLFQNKNTNVGIAVFMCPGRGRPIHCSGSGGPGAWSDYFINPFLNDPNGDPDSVDSRRTLVGILDGLSNTILAGHGQINPAHYSSISVIPGFDDVIFSGGSVGMCRHNASVVNERDSSHPPAQPGNWGGPFAEGSLVVMADGVVRLFPYSITGGVITDGESDGPAHAFGAYLTPSGGEPTTTPEHLAAAHWRSG